MKSYKLIVKQKAGAKKLRFDSVSRIDEKLHFDSEYKEKKNEKLQIDSKARCYELLLIERCWLVIFAPKW